MAVKLKKSSGEIKSELTPSLRVCVNHYLGESTGEKLANPSYFFQNTLIKGPLEDFLRTVFRGFSSTGPTVLPLRIGFGFGKTHAQILLLHAMLAFNRLPEEAEEVLRRMGWNEEIAAKAIVLPLDFFHLDPPFPWIAKVLRAHADEGTEFFRNKEVAHKIDEHKDSLLGGFLESDRLAELLSDIALNTDSPVVIMVDEFGYGFVKRVERFIEARRQDKVPEKDPLAEIVWLSSFLTSLASRSEREGFPLVIIYAWAEQDAETLRYYAAENERVNNILGIVRGEVLERLSRYTGGMEEGPLGLNPDDMLDIAIFRVLDVEEGEAERTAEQIAGIAEAYGAISPSERGAFTRAIRRHYPLSPAFARALRKFARREELPGAEHVRSAIYSLSLAAERAFRDDPRSPLIDVKHLSFEEACFLGHMGDLRGDWASLLSDLIETVDSSEPRIKMLCEHVAKLILAKAATANVLDIERAQDPSRAPVYGLTEREIISSIICTTPADKVSDSISMVKEALSYLVSRSGRIEERVIEGERFYFPAIFGTVFGRLRVYLADEGKTAEKEGIEYLKRSKLLNELLSSVRVEGCSIFRLDLNILRDPKGLRLRIGSSLNDPHPAFVLIEPWSESLSKEMEVKKRFETLASHLITEMNQMDYVEALSRPNYLILLLPNIERSRIEELLQPLIEYEATTKFLDYLEKEEDIRREMLNKALSTAAVKRVKLNRRDVERIIRERVRQEIEAAESAAHSIRLRAAREAVLKFLKLFDRYIAYDLSSRAFTLQSLSQQFTAAQGRLEEIKDPSQCADAMGAFFNGIVGVRYVRDVSSLEGIVQRIFEERVNHDLLDSLSVDELVESFVQGAYEILPLNGELIKDAIYRMSGFSFDLVDKRITVRVEDGKISFEEVKIEKEEEEGGETEEGGFPPPRKIVRGFSFQALSRDRAVELANLIKEGKVSAKSVAAELKGENIGGTLRFEGDFKPLTAAFNALSSIALNYRANLKISVSLERETEEEELREILGDLAENLQCFPEQFVS